MKKYLLLTLIFSLCTLVCLAQEEEEISTIFGSGIVHNGGYGAVEVKICPASDYSFWVGGRGGWIINRSFSIGGAGYGLMPINSFDCPTHSLTEGTKLKSRYAGGYGGLFLEYINSSNSIIHLTGNLLIGVGGLTYFDTYDTHSNIYNNDKEHPAAMFFTIEPGINADINIAKFVRIGVGVSYKFAPYFDVVYGFNNGDILGKSKLNGLAINLVCKFGKF